MWREIREDELVAFVQQNISPLAELLEGHSERQLYQLPPRSEGLKLGKVLEVVEAQKDSPWAQQLWSCHKMPKCTSS